MTSSELLQSTPTGPRWIPSRGFKPQSTERPHAGDVTPSGWAVGRVKQG